MSLALCRQTGFHDTSFSRGASSLTHYPPNYTLQSERPLLGSVYNATLGKVRNGCGEEGRMAEAVQVSARVKPWCLQQAEGLGQRGRGQSKNSPGFTKVLPRNSILTRHGGGGAVSKVDLLGVWRVLLQGTVRTFQPGDERNQVRYAWLVSKSKATWRMFAGSSKLMSKCILFWRPTSLYQ